MCLTSITVFTLWAIAGCDDVAAFSRVPKKVHLTSRSLEDGSMARELWDKITRYDKTGGYLTISGRKTWVDVQTFRGFGDEQELVWKSSAPEYRHMQTSHENWTDTYPPGSVVDIIEEY